MLSRVQIARASRFAAPLVASISVSEDGFRSTRQDYSVTEPSTKRTSCATVLPARHQGVGDRVHPGRAPVLPGRRKARGSAQRSCQSSQARERPASVDRLRSQLPKVERKLPVNSTSPASRRKPDSGSWSASRSHCTPAGSHHPFIDLHGRRAQRGQAGGMRALNAAHANSDSR